MELTSPGFKNGHAIPERFAGEGTDISPKLEWSDAPENTRSYALLVEDPDAPKRKGEDHPFVHWLAYNIPANVSELPEGLPKNSTLEIPVFIDQGTNSFGDTGFGGPMPPVGHGVHHYHFRLFALDAMTSIPPGASKSEVIHAIRPHIMGEATLIGTYERTKESLAFLNRALTNEKLGSHSRV